MLSKLKLSILIGSFLILAALPMITEAIDEPFYIDLMARVMIFSIAAMSLDFILGYGAMISFGHALYLGLGTYAVGIMAHYEVTNGWLQLLVCISGTAFIAFILGLISLRTSGIYFIMITFALAQMFYFLGISLEAYGGDDGLPIDTRSEFFSFFDLNDAWNMYYLILGTMTVTAIVLWKIINSRFGMVVRGSHSNDARMQAIGFPTMKYRLAAFVIAGVVCGLAGFLLGNLTEFLTPEYMHWFPVGRADDHGDGRRDGNIVRAALRRLRLSDGRGLPRQFHRILAVLFRADAHHPRAVRQAGPLGHAAGQGGHVR